MDIQKNGDYIILRIAKGEEILSALKQITQDHRLKGAFFSGLGVGQDLILGYYDSHRKTYVKKLFEGEYEFTNISGNIALFEKEIVVHCHVTISNDQFHAFGGHLFQGTVPATCEIMVLPFKKPLKRKKDSRTGLALLALTD